MIANGDEQQCQSNHHEEQIPKEEVLDCWRQPVESRLKHRPKLKADQNLGPENQNMVFAESLMHFLLSFTIGVLGKGVREGSILFGLLPQVYNEAHQSSRCRRRARQTPSTQTPA